MRENNNFSSAEFVCVISEEHRHLGKSKIVNDLFYSEEKKIKGILSIIEYRFFITNDWKLYTQEFTHRKTESVVDREEVEMNGYK